MATIKIINLSVPAGKSLYSSELLTNKRTELINAGDLLFTIQTLPNGDKEVKLEFIDESKLNSYESWLISSGELEKIQKHVFDNDIVQYITYIRP